MANFKPIIAAAASRGFLAATRLSCYRRCCSYAPPVTPQVQ